MTRRWIVIDCARWFHFQDYAERYHKLGGGGISCVEIDNDAPLENVKALIESIHEYR